jgi:hypothetical protein
MTSNESALPSRTVQCSDIRMVSGEFAMPMLDNISAARRPFVRRDRFTDEGHLLRLRPLLLPAALLHLSRKSAIHSYQSAQKPIQLSRQSTHSARADVRTRESPSLLPRRGIRRKRIRRVTGKKLRFHQMNQPDWAETACVVTRTVLSSIDGWLFLQRGVVVVADVGQDSAWRAPLSSAIKLAHTGTPGRNSWCRRSGR